MLDFWSGCRGESQTEHGCSSIVLHYTSVQSIRSQPYTSPSSETHSCRILLVSCYSSQLRTCSTSSALENICLTRGRKTGVAGLAHTPRTGRLSFHALRNKNIFAKNSFNAVHRLNKRKFMLWCLQRDLCIA